MALLLPRGTSDFAQVRRDGLHYVDKTGFAVEVIRSTSRVALIPRPRRFGKTINLSMLRYWLERPVPGAPAAGDIATLFEDLEIATAGDDVAAHFQRHPVIFLTFKDAKGDTWAPCRAAIQKELAREVGRLRTVWEPAPLTAGERRTLEAVDAEAATDGDMEAALLALSRGLHLATGEEVVVLIDEYDAAIHAGWAQGYYDPVLTLCRNLLSAGLKDNKHLYRGVITGILRVAKESIFSGLNNVAVYTLLAEEYSKWFGFSEREVEELCALSDPAGDLPGIVMAWAQSARRPATTWELTIDTNVSSNGWTICATANFA